MERASSGANTTHQGFDISKLRQEAQMRWLKPSEVLFILQNHERYPLSLEPPQKPPGGSFFLFNRRVLRFFRKDGYMWRKKKDGRSLGEAHERLKVGNVDALNCYYAHGELNPYFQRRSYWMLDPAYEHIVLVHYREVSEGRYVSRSISNLTAESFSSFSQSTSISKAHFDGFTSRTGELQEQYRNSFSPASVEEVSSKFAMENIEADRLNSIKSSGQPEVNEVLRKLETQLSLDDDVDNAVHFEEQLPAYCTQYEKSQNSILPYHKSLEESHGTLAHELADGKQHEVEVLGKQVSYSSTHLLKLLGDGGKQQIQSLGSGYPAETKQSHSWKDMLELTANSTEINTQGGTSNSLALEDIPETPNSRITSVAAHFPPMKMLNNGSDTLLTSAGRQKISEKMTWQQFDHEVNNLVDGPNEKYQIPESDLPTQLSATRCFLLGSDNTVNPRRSISQLQGVDTSITSTLEADSSVMMRRKDSTDWMGALDLAVEDYSDFSGMWFEQSRFGNSLSTESSLTVAEKQHFRIREISPEWGFSLESTKVIITGDFLCSPSEFSWAIMFGEIEVPLEIVQEGVLRCQAPPCDVGKVTLCVTSGSRESCSEIREFEFRAKPTCIGTSPQIEATKKTEEVLLLARFAHILLCGYDGPSTPIGGIGQETEHSTEAHWQQIIEALQCGCESPSEALDWILQELLKDKVRRWFMCKYQGKDGEGCLLSKQEQRIIHMISGLGYEWALGPLLDSGVGINFRDVNGWTPLHWAAHFGREKMVAALLASGASAGAVTDPTPQDPVGKTAGAIAASSGHKGLAGYLSEVALNSHLSSLTMQESEISKGSAMVEAERAVENLSDMSQLNGGTEDELSLKDSLAAVRNAVTAAARIQAAFRAHSFRMRRQKSAASQGDFDMTAEDMHALSAALKFQRSGHGYRDMKFDEAALSIQKKYRGWKGRKDFLDFRQSVVKIQAHVRGHQMRKKFKEFLWAVGVVEKVVLRWRRKGVGLRGFRVEEEMIDEGEDEDIIKVFRKKKVDAVLEAAVSRVLSIVPSPDARQQYRRMLESYRHAKAELGNADEATRYQDDFENSRYDEHIY